MVEDVLMVVGAKDKDRKYMINASTGTVKNFDCGDIGHKRLACPHRQEEGAEVGAADWEELTGSTKLSQVKESAAPPSQPNSVPPAPVVDQTVAESALPSTKNCDSYDTAQLLHGLPQMHTESIAALECDITLEELTSAVSQLCSGRSPAKLAIWMSKKNKMLDKAAVDVVAMFKGLVAARLKIDHAYYSMP
ncbi:inositol 1,4,5-triphosphate receptor associated 2-like [Tachysurus ichikawai]